MKTFIKILLILCVITLVQQCFINSMYHTSRQLALMGNLPHRFLGGLFWAQQCQPQREDYAYTYFVEWLLADKEERFLEGQTRPVVPELIVKRSKEFPKDPDLAKLAEIATKDYIEKKEKKK